MDTVIEIIAISAVCLMSFSIYVFLISEIIPKYLLRLFYDFRDNLGRGLKKFTYSEGRAVVYEPHPSVRKYVNGYALFTIDGYKYLEVRTGEGVRNYTARLVTFNNRNKVVDVLDVSQTVEDASVGIPFRLHDSTSYVALAITSVNKTAIPSESHVSMRLVDMPLYFAAVFAATLLMLLHIITSVKEIVNLLDLELPLYNGYSFFILPAVIVGVFCLILTVIGRKRKGVKVVLK